jgi:FKBP-type peptidyl-prolyl cis-trans isomerase (trigger factor)
MTDTKIPSTFKKLDNGNIEIVFSISGDYILKEKQATLIEKQKDITISGFRKGKAPLSKVEETVSEEKLTEHILSHILPHAFSDSVATHKFNPAMYPKFEAVKITSSKNVGEDTVWEIKAITCELPKVVLPKDYTKKLKKDEKDQNVLVKSLLETVKLDIPRLLIEEEVNGRLAQVLDRIEKLGLTLEGYLKSVGKTPEILRAEYEIQSKDAISLELVLNSVANEEKIDVEDKEVDEFIKSTGEDEKKVGEEQRNILKRVILRRKALEKLASK